MEENELYNQLHEALIDTLKLAYEKDYPGFMELYKSLCEHFYNEINNIDKKEDYVKFLKISKNLRDKIINSLESVLKGNVSYVYRSMSLWWSTPSKKSKDKNTSSKDQDILGSYGKLYTISEDENYYRARKLSLSEKVTYNKMFAVPFELRRKIGNERYSVAGYPCLYAAKSVYACWAEIDYPPIDSFCVSLLRVNSSNKFNLLDLRHNQSCKSREDVLSYLIMIPLIMACSIPVKDEDKKHPFKLEYVFPQLLMNAVTIGKCIKGQTVDGVIYTSVTSPHNDKSTVSHDYDCIAIPVLSRDVKNHSDTQSIEQRFRSFFQITNPIHYEYEILYNQNNTNQTIYNDIFDYLQNELNNKTPIKL